MKLEVAASLEHPHLAPVYDAGEDGGRLFVVMRFLDGVDLGTALARWGALPPDYAARVVEQVGGALDAAHARELVHRDVKPANIMLVGTGADTRAYLTDFGLAKAQRAAETVTALGSMVGTADYMAPEQFESGAVDGRADVYALGGVLYQALTAAVPFPRESDASRMYAHLSVPPPAPSAMRPGLPAGFDAVVARSMAKNPSQRYGSAGELGRAAVAAASSGPVSGASGPTATWVGAAIPASASPPTPRSSVPQSSVPTGLWPGHPSYPSNPSVAPGSRDTYVPGRPGTPGGAGPPVAAPSAGASRRRGWVVGAAALLVALLVLGAVLLRPAGADEPVGSPIAVGAEPVLLEEGGGSVWVANRGDGTVTRVDQATGRTSSVNVGGAPVDLAFENGSLWVYNYAGTLTRFDPATDATSQVALPPGQIVDVENAGGFVWVTGAVPDAVVRVNATTGVVQQFPLPGGPTWMVGGRGFLYVVTATPTTLTTLDPATGSVAGTTPIAGESGGVDLVDGTLYVGITGPPGPDGARSFAVTPYEQRTLTPAPPIDAGGAVQMVFGRDSYWAAYPFENAIRRFSLPDRQPEGEPLAGVGRDVVWMQVIGGQLWVLDAEARAVTRYDVGD